MARTKRKTDPRQSRTPAPEEKPAVSYRTAGYARLSVEDSGKPGAETLEAQCQLLREYIAGKPELELCAVYSDNGTTGTDFKRPAFERMMDAVRRGEINCIVVKDLSRFGRNYKETGQYLERIFPFLGVRFLAINDNVDTLRAQRGGDGYSVPLKNLINEAYSRDISQKVSSVLRRKQRQGEFIGDWAPYGYRKDPEDRHKLLPNPDTAPAVQRIFQLRLQGMSYAKIVRTLNEEEVPSPARYLAEAGLCKRAMSQTSLWNATTVRKLLAHPVYIGHMVQGVRRGSFYDGRTRQKPEDWCVVQNTHPPIVEEEVFWKVQELAGKKRADCCFLGQGEPETHHLK